MILPSFIFVSLLKYNLEQTDLIKIKTCYVNTER